MIAYLAHPVGGTDGHAMVEQAQNVSNGGRWWKFITLHTSWSVMIPWSPHYVYGDSRIRAIDDQVEILDACGVLILTGEYIAGYMEILRERAYLRQMPILNLIDLGDEVPEWLSNSEGREMLRNRAAIIGVQIDQGPKELLYDQRKYNTDLNSDRSGGPEDGQRDGDFESGGDPVEEP